MIYKANCLLLKFVSAALKFHFQKKMRASSCVCARVLECVWV